MADDFDEQEVEDVSSVSVSPLKLSPVRRSAPGNDGKIVFFVFAAVLVVGSIAMLGLVNQPAGEVTGQSYLETRYCCCSMELFGYYGDSLGTQIQKIRTTTSGGLDNCNNRCDLMFSRITQSSNRVLTGYVC